MAPAERAPAPTPPRVCGGEFSAQQRAAALGLEHRPLQHAASKVTATATVEYSDDPELERWLGHWLRRSLRAHEGESR